MDNVQKNKEQKIKSAITTELPTPKVDNIKTPIIPATKVEEEFNPFAPSKESTPPSIAPANVVQEKNPFEIRKQDLKVDTEGEATHKLQALRDFLETSDDPEATELKIGQWNIPRYSSAGIAVTAIKKFGGAMSKAETQVPDIEEIKNLPPEQMGEIRKIYNIASIPADVLTNTLVDLVHEEQAKLGWDEARTKSVLMNMALNMAHDTPEVAARFVGSALDPLTIASLGYGKGVASLGKSTLGKETIIPAIKATTDYIAGKLPDWIVKPFVYKFGLPEKQEFMEIAGARIRNIKQWYETAMETGAKLHDGLSPEAQKLSKRLLTKEYSDKDLDMLANYTKKQWDEFGVKNPEQFMSDITAARAISDESSDVFIEEALRSKFINKKVANIIKANRGKYMPRLYEIFEKPEILDNVKSGKMSIDQALGLLEDDVTFFKRVTNATDDSIASFMALSKKAKDDLLNKMGRKVTPSAGPKTKPISATLNSLKKRGDLDIVKRTAMKEIQTSAYPVAKHIKDTRTATENLIFFRKLKEFGGEVGPMGNKVQAKWLMNPKGQMPTGWKQIPKDNRFGDISGMWAHPQVADDILSIHNINKTGNAFFDILTTTNKIWKANHVIWNPATHVRNLISNTILLDLSGVPLYTIPSLLVRAQKEIGKKGSIYKKAVQHNVMGSDFVGSEMSDFLPEVETLSTSSMMNKGLRGVRGAFKKAGDVYRSEEELYKVAKMMHGIESGLTDKEAAEDALKWLFDYSKVSPIVDGLRTNVFWNVPFVTFTAKSLPRVAEGLIKNPYKVYKYNQLLNFMNDASARSVGLNEKEADYIRSKKGIGFISPTRDQNGEPMWVDLNAMFPWAELSNKISGAPSGESAVPSSISPGGIGKIAYDLYYNKNTYTGKEIYDTTGTDRHQLAQATGYAYKQFAPPLNPLPLAGMEKYNIQTIGTSAQKLADSFYASGVMPEAMVARLLAKKEGYYGASKGVPFAILDALLGVSVTPVQEWVALKYDSKDLKAGMKQAKMILKNVARDQGIDTNDKTGKQMMENAERIMNENMAKALEDFDRTQNPVKGF